MTMLFLFATNLICLILKLDKNISNVIFRWSDGNELVYEPWGPSQPNRDGNEKCIFTKTSPAALGNGMFQAEINVTLTC